MLFMLFVAVVILLLAYWSFETRTRAQVARLLSEATPQPETVITEDRLAGLPDPVRRYLTHAGVVGKSVPTTVRVRQTGRIRPRAGLPWLPFQAEQHFSVQPPGFIWDASVLPAGLPAVKGRDTYRQGRGRMQIEVASLFPVVGATGPEMDQGAMMRYLGEMIWFPAAFLGPNVRFEPIDDNAARVTLTDGTQTVSAVLHVDAEGKLMNFVAQRYREVDGSYSLDMWHAPTKAYGERAGVRMPVRSSAVWKLPDGDLEYIDLTITDVEYN